MQHNRKTQPRYGDLTDEESHMDADNRPIRTRPPELGLLDAALNWH